MKRQTTTTTTAAPYTFTGGTDRGSFTCHCSPDVQCDDATGACPGGACGVSGSFLWGGITCQIGSVAQLGGTADQTGSAGHVAERCIDGDTNNVITQRSCCNPGRSSGALSWSVDLRGTFAISYLDIYTAGAGNHRNTIIGVEVYVSSSRTPTDSELCGVQSGSVYIFTTVRCPTMVGRYLIIRQPAVNMAEMMFCEVQVQGYQYYSCGFYDGDYRYGPGCVQNCHCKHQCDVITGVCDGDCTSGWRKVNDACALTCTSGFWGVNCESNCHCASHNRACDSVTGACDADCDSGYSGFNCQTECDDRHWGSNCVHECHCDCGRITGLCNGRCDPGYDGNRCQHECTDGTWGIGNKSRCPNNCYCTCTVTCDKVNGRCDGPCVATYVNTLVPMVHGEKIVRTLVTVMLMKSVRRLMVLVIDVQIGLLVSVVTRNFHEWRPSLQCSQWIIITSLLDSLHQTMQTIILLNIEQMETG